MKLYEVLATIAAFVCLGIFIDDHFFWAAILLACVLIVSFLITLSEDNEDEYGNPRRS